MNVSQPPRLAAWLLTRLASGPRQESLIGDLMEQYQRRRSAAWYWRQVLTAIVVGVVHDMRHHSVLVVRSIGVFAILVWLLGKIAFVGHSWLGVWVWNWSVVHGFDTLRVLWFGRPRSGLPSIAVIIEMLTMCANAAISGWVVGRLHRGHVAATLISCAVLNSTFWLWPFLFAWLLEPEAFWGAIAFNPVFFVTQLGWHFVGVPLSILLGGLWPALPKLEASRDLRVE